MSQSYERDDRQFSVVSVINKTLDRRMIPVSHGDKRVLTIHDRLSEVTIMISSVTPMY